MSGSIGKSRVILELLTLLNSCPVPQFSGCIVGVEGLSVALGVCSQGLDLREQGVYQFVLVIS